MYPEFLSPDLDFPHNPPLPFSLPRQLSQPQFPCLQQEPAILFPNLHLEPGMISTEQRHICMSLGFSSLGPHWTEQDAKPTMTF